MKKIALLIDGDNINLQRIPLIIKKSKTIGKIKVKKVFAISDKFENKEYIKIIQNYDIQIVQNNVNKISGKTQKNSTDYFLMDDVEKILQNKKIDIFCIATGDGDFVGMIDTIKKQGKEVYGFGARNANQKLLEKCNQFFFFDNLEKELSYNKKEIIKQLNDLIERYDKTVVVLTECLNKISLQLNELNSKPVVLNDDKSKIKQLVLDAVKEECEKENPANISKVLARIKSKQPDFDYKKYNSKWLKFLSSFSELQAKNNTVKIK
ncbi:MAG: NYN domain-containing protein [Neisseriaceae bacterium]|nr:NYN domain-containing protein [Neisseriaceae bacterium]